ncbi:MULTISPECIES: DsbA family oxidoreductase [Saccharothrix]|uniref:DsbA family oxidoreductase n=1 Tax=Saccharothrix TaxID=2071 RepID=UPI0019174DF1|nr:MULTISPECIES: DsbA family oxidoreductase [Saccharothrix]
MSGNQSLRLDVWSDFACPWCYIGKRRLEGALARFEHADDVEVVWRSFELNARIPKGTRQPDHEYLAEKLTGTVERAKALTRNVTKVAAGDGLAFDYDNTLSVNTFDAHRFAHLAMAHGIGDEMHERLFSARLVTGEAINDPEVLTRIAVEVGVPEADAQRVATSDAHAEDVRRDEAEASRIGATGVPFVVFDGRYAVSGAQPVETFLSTLHKAYEPHTSTGVR